MFIQIHRVESDLLTSYLLRVSMFINKFKNIKRVHFDSYSFFKKYLAEFQSHSYCSGKALIVSESL
jgi:hypothetical protein